MLKGLSKDPSFTLLRVGGVPVRLQASFFIMPLWAAVAGYLGGEQGWHGALFMLAFLGSIYACAALHELGHILPARHFGTRITRIRVSAMGAFVQVDRQSRSNPAEDLLIALGGPLVTALISVVLTALAWPLWQSVGPQLLLQRGSGTLLLLLAITNVLLTVFNLLPVAPMDGAHALRAALALWAAPTPQAQAASAFGQVVAVAIVIATALVSAPLHVRGAAIAVAGMIFAGSYRKRSGSGDQLD